MKNTAISLSGHIIKEDEAPVSEQEYEDFFDKFIAFVESVNYGYFGSANLVDAEVEDEASS